MSDNKSIGRVRPKPLTPPGEKTAEARNHVSMRGFIGQELKKEGW